jgi:hypothetical protein
MNRLQVRLVAAAGSLLFSNLIAAQVGPYVPKTIPPPAPAAAHVRITQGPELELASADDKSAIIRWTSDNPGGSDEHFGVVHYGTNPKDLNQTAQSHIRLNRNHPTTVFRVFVPGLQPKTTYYYTVDSTRATGKSDGVKSPVKSFSMP